jgi:hypothetical protein
MIALANIQMLAITPMLLVLQQAQPAAPCMMPFRGETFMGSSKAKLLLSTSKETGIELLSRAEHDAETRPRLTALSVTLTLIL